MTATASATRIARGIVRVAPKLILIALLVPFLVYAAPQVAGAEASYVVLSGSMEPAISTGDVVVVYDSDPAMIDEGDVITFRQEGDDTPVTHRVVGVVDRPGQEVAFRTKGDANEDPDPSPVPASSVVGRVPMVSLPVVGPTLVRFPYMGYLVAFTGSQYGYVALIGVPIALLIASEIWSLARSERGKDDREEGDPGADDGGPDAATGAVENDQGDPATGAGDAREDRTTAAPEGDREEPGEDHTYTVSAADLTMTVGAMVLLAAYSAFVAYRTQSPVSVSVAVAAIGCAGLVGALRYLSTGRSPDDGGGRVQDSSSGPDDDAGGRSVSEGGAGPEPPRVSGTVPEGSDITRLQLASLEALGRVAEERGRPVLTDPETGEAVVVDRGVVYAAPNDADATADGHEEDVMDDTLEEDATDDTGGSAESETSEESETSGESEERAAEAVAPDRPLVFDGDTPLLWDDRNDDSSEDARSDDGEASDERAEADVSVPGGDRTEGST